MTNYLKRNKTSRDFGQHGKVTFGESEKARPSVFRPVQPRQLQAASVPGTVTAKPNSRGRGEGAADDGTAMDGRAPFPTGFGRDGRDRISHGPPNFYGDLKHDAFLTDAEEAKDGGDERGTFLRAKHMAADLARCGTGPGVPPDPGAAGPVKPGRKGSASPRGCPEALPACRRSPRRRGYRRASKPGRSGTAPAGTSSVSARCPCATAPAPRPPPRAPSWRRRRKSREGPCQPSGRGGRGSDSL
jgi:hypothetical protein